MRKQSVVCLALMAMLVSVAAGAENIRKDAKDGSIIGFVTVTGSNSVHIKDSYELDANVIKRASPQDVLQCTGLTKNNEYKLLLEDGREGYIPQETAVFSPFEPVSERSRDEGNGAAIVTGKSTPKTRNNGLMYSEELPSKKTPAPKKKKTYTEGEKASPGGTNMSWSGDGTFSPFTPSNGASCGSTLPTLCAP